MRFWVGVASKEHVAIGSASGFCQLCHGKAAPLKRMRGGDLIVYYSPKLSMNDTKPYQMFTAIGRLKNDETYQVEMFEGFFPFRKDVEFFESKDAPIAALVDELAFIVDKKRWGYPFRYGHLEVCRDDFLAIASKMVNENILNQLKGGICK